MGESRVVALAGASAGIGRAYGREFGARGDPVARLARGEVSLAGARRDVEGMGGQGLCIPTDVADHAHGEAVAAEVVSTWGEIDIWINAAFVAVLAPFLQAKPDEFKRVTEVAYLGYVYGTQVALSRMVPRDRGTVVQVGSARGRAQHPVALAPCGAKHAVNGFTSSIRTEFMHDTSKVRTTLAQMPAVNTPQFSWVLSRPPRQPQPVPPIYQSVVAVREVVYAAEHSRRKQYWAGASTVTTVAANKVVAPLLDRYLARTGVAAQQTAERFAPDRPHNLREPVDAEPGTDRGTHGVLDASAHCRAPQLWFSQHAGGLSASSVAVAAGIITSWSGRRSEARRTTS